MGKVTGFLEFERLEEGYEPVPQRLKTWREFVIGLSEEQSRIQAARCMDCGTPFCNHGCPVNNIIPDFNDLVYRGDWRRAIEVLHSTNNFPEFTGRICPAPCEAACTLNVNDDAVGIKSIEHAIIDRAWAEGWVLPQPPATRSGKTVAIVGSGPAGMAAAQQLARAGHAVTVFEKNSRLGGLLRYGIPDFKMEKSHIDRRVAQLQAEGVVFRTGVLVGALPAEGAGSRIGNDAKEVVGADRLLADFDAVLLAGGSEVSRDLPVPGRELDGVHFAMEFLPQQNRRVAGDEVPASEAILATDKHVVVIGGGDTGSDCIGTSHRQGAKSVTSLELLPTPPKGRHASEPWPLAKKYYFNVSSSHVEGGERIYAIQTTRLEGRDGRVTALHAIEVAFDRDELDRPIMSSMREVPGSEHVFPADLVLLAMGFVHPVREGLLAGLGVDLDPRGNVAADTRTFGTSEPGVFVAGDARRGQSLVVWAQWEGRECARQVDAFLMGSTRLQSRNAVY